MTVQSFSLWEPAFASIARLLTCVLNTRYCVVDNADPQKTRAAHEVNDIVTRVGSPGGQDPSTALWSIAGAADGRPNCQRLACAVVNGKPGSTAVYVSQAPCLLPRSLSLSSM